MDDEEIVIGINHNNKNSKNRSNKTQGKTTKNKSNSEKNYKSKTNKKTANSDFSSDSERKMNLKKVFRFNKNNNLKNNTKIPNKNNNKKSNSKTRIGLTINSSKNSVETKNKKAKIVLGLLIILIFIIVLFSSNLFNIKTINVNGNNILSDEMIISISGIEKYTNIFKFNKISTINNIESNAYIENAKIKRVLPSTIEINIKERVPTFILQFADSYVYINNQGYILEISNEKKNIPILAGCTTDLVNMKPGNRIGEEDLKKMNTVIKICEIAKSNELGDLITKIDVSDTKNYTIVLESEGKTVYLGDCSDSDLNTKMLYLKSIIDASQGRAGEVFLNIDLNSQNVYVRWSTE